MANPFNIMFNSLVNQNLNKFLNESGNNVTPTQQNYIDVIRSGDSSRGEELATNLCNSMGMSKEQALAQARQFFHI